MSKHHEIIFVYESGDADRLKEISEYAEVVQYVGQKIYGDKCIWCTSWGKRPEKDIIANEHIQICHCDYKIYKDNNYFVYKKLKKVTRHISVGQNTAKTLKEVYRL